MRIIPKTKKRKLLLFIVIVAIGIGIYFFFFKGDSQSVFGPKDPHANSFAANNLNCGLSVATEEGPFYVSDTAKLSGGNLNRSKLEGEKIKIAGYVYEGETKDHKIASAKVEIWQPDTYGTYYPADSGKAAKFRGQLKLRGFVNSDKYGYFEFTTIYPGPSENRARHIYLKASADGYQELTTQLVMSRSGDLVSVYDDEVAGELPSCNVMNFGAVEGIAASGYDFHLQKASAQ